MKRVDLLRLLAGTPKRPEPTTEPDWLGGGWVRYQDHEYFFVNDGVISVALHDVNDHPWRTLAIENIVEKFHFVERCFRWTRCKRRFFLEFQLCAGNWTKRSRKICAEAIIKRAIEEGP